MNKSRPVHGGFPDAPQPEPVTAGREPDAYLIADDRSVSLADCPIGLFMCDGELCLKTEYLNNEGRIDAYIVSSGEFFWGSQPQTIANQRAQRVVPISVVGVDTTAALAADAILPVTAIECERFSLNAEAQDDGLVRLIVYRTTDAGPVLEFKPDCEFLVDYPHAVEALGTLAIAVEAVRPKAAEQ